MNNSAYTDHEIVALSLTDLAKELRKRTLSAAEVTEAYLSNIHRKEDSVHSYISVTESLARENAVAADRLLAEGKGGALCGCPCSIKDNITVKGYPTTCASRMLYHFVPPYSATACEKIWREGGVVLGKVNMDEFAMGSSCEKSVFGPTHNPLDLTRSPGGSSGGSAASVAAGEAVFSLGTDTGGSARQPAAFCGLVSMKPTYGLVSRYGVVELASSLDQVSPITRNVADNAQVLSAICGYDKKDMTSLDDTYDKDYLTASVNITGLKVGVIADFESFCDHTVTMGVHRTAEKLRRLGAFVDEAILPSPDMALNIYVITTAAEASSNLARYDGIKYGYSTNDVITSRSTGFGEEVRRRIITGTYVLSSTYKGDYYRKIKVAERELCRRVDELFHIYDIILMPTTGSVAFCLGAFDQAPTSLYSSDMFTVYANLTGCPAITIPCGGDGVLPCGVTMMGRRMSEKLLYGTAAVLEAELSDDVNAEVKRDV